MQTMSSDNVWVIRPTSVRAFIEAQRDWIDACFDVLEKPPSDVTIDAALNLVTMEVNVHVLLERELLFNACNQTLDDGWEIRMQRSHARLNEMIAGLEGDRQHPCRLEVFTPTYRAQFMQHIDLTIECLAYSMDAAADKQESFIDWLLLTKSNLVNERKTLYPH